MIVECNHCGRLIKVHWLKSIMFPPCPYILHVCKKCRQIGRHQINRIDMGQEISKLRGKVDYETQCLKDLGEETETQTEALQEIQKRYRNGI